MAALVLASSSRYRQQLLERLQIPFQCYSPNVDETALPGESPVELVRRLALAKAIAVSRSYRQHLIIGSDQVAELDGDILTKPGNPANARSQLRLLSGRQARFHTGLCVLDSTTAEKQEDVVTTEVCFRQLSDTEIDSYLDKEQPWDCAGSFKSEQLGISLLNEMRGMDPTALIGLPLICLSRMLRHHGLKLP